MIPANTGESILKRPQNPAATDFCTEAKPKTTIVTAKSATIRAATRENTVLSRTCRDLTRPAGLQKAGRIPLSNAVPVSCDEQCVATCDDNTAGP